MGIIIKQTAVKVLDENDMDFIESLRGLKIPRGAAALITYLANNCEATSREIEMATGISQPNVSIAMRILQENNWVTEREIRTKGKGRPKKIYNLAISIEKIIECCATKKKQRAGPSRREGIQRLGKKRI